MFKKFKPFCHAKNVYEIDINFFKKLGVKYVFTDLDNTLDSYRLYTPSEKAVDFKKKLNELGIELIIISNNKGHRVGSYSDKLGIRYAHSMFKPFSSKLKKFIKENNINPDEVVMIGDQMITDIRCANGAGIKKNILVDKLVKEDQWTTHINRFFERPYRNHCMKKHAFKEWSEIYG